MVAMTHARKEKAHVWVGMVKYRQFSQEKGSRKIGYT
jgi:hypothetical protein